MIKPYLFVHDADKAIEFYEASFGARPMREPYRLETGEISDATINFPDGSQISLTDELPEHGIVGPRSLSGTSVMLSLEVEDVNATASRFLDAGGSVIREVAAPYGVRGGTLRDPFGHIWLVSSRRSWGSTGS